MQDIILFPGIERIESKRVKTSGNVGEMPFDEISCCLKKKIPGLNAESFGMEISVMQLQHRELGMPTENCG